MTGSSHRMCSRGSNIMRRKLAVKDSELSGYRKGMPTLKR